MILFQLRNEILKIILAKFKEENQMVDRRNELLSQIRRQVRFINLIISHKRSNLSSHYQTRIRCVNGEVKVDVIIATYR